MHICCKTLGTPKPKPKQPIVFKDGRVWWVDDALYSKIMSMIKELKCTQVI
jgi:hypothetical protein